MSVYYNHPQLLFIRSLKLFGSSPQSSVPGRRDTLPPHRVTFFGGRQAADNRHQTATLSIYVNEAPRYVFKERQAKKLS